MDGTGSTQDGRRMREVRSFVLRQARMSKAQHRAYDTLHSRYVVESGDEPVDLRKLFELHRAQPTEQREEPCDVQEGHACGSGAADGDAIGNDAAEEAPRCIVAEVGFGMGEATVQIAAANPDKDYLGIEVHRPGVGKLLAEVEARGLWNVLIVQDDAVRVFERMIPPGALAGIHIFFPDPWPKKRHHKRRLLQSGAANLLASRLRNGGYLYVATDWEEYAGQMLEVLTGIRTLSNTAIDFAPRQPWRPVTKFEEKGLSKGHRIFELLFRKRDDE